MSNAVADATAEDITAKRRRERQQFKSDRAKAIAAAALEAEQAFAEGRELPTVPSIAIPSSATWRPTAENRVGPSSSGLQNEETIEEEVEEEEEELENLEHLQLTLPEAFFLAWTLQCLFIINPETVRPHIPSHTKSHYILPGRTTNPHRPLARLPIPLPPPIPIPPTLTNRINPLPLRQPLPHQLRPLPPLPLPRLGRQNRHQILRRLPPLQTRAGLPSR